MQKMLLWKCEHILNATAFRLPLAGGEAGVHQLFSHQTISELQAEIEKRGVQPQNLGWGQTPHMLYAQQRHREELFISLERKQTPKNEDPIDSAARDAENAGSFRGAPLREPSPGCGPIVNGASF